jgi:hypothetical protein
MARGRPGSPAAQARPIACPAPGPGRGSARTAATAGHAAVPDGSALTSGRQGAHTARGHPPGCAAGVRHAAAGVHCAPAADHPRPSPPAGKSPRPHAAPARRRPGLPSTPERASTCRTTPAPGPWLQFWLQFTTVRAMPSGYAPQVTDFPGLARTVDPRPFNPWVQGSSPWRPTRSELQESLATGLAMPAWRGTTRSAASAHTMHTVHYLRIRRVTDPRFRARGGRLKRSGAGSTMSGRTTRDADHGCATMGDHDRKSSGRRFRAMAEHAARRARHSRQCHGLAGPPVPVRLSGRTDS